MLTGMDPVQATERARRVVAVFDRVADVYDQVGVGFFGPIAEMLVEGLRPRAGERTVDIGCGRGAVTRRLADRIRPGGHVDAFDLAGGMVEQTRRELAELGYEDVTLSVRDAGAPGLPMAVYDVVASSLVLFFLPDPAAALRAWLALLRPGGRLGVTTFGARSPIWEQVDALFRPHLPAPMLDARTTGERGPFASADGTAALVAAAGFEQVRVVEANLPVRFDSADQWYEWSWSIGQRAMWESVPVDSREALRADAYALLAEARTTEGSVVLDQVIRVTTGIRPTV